jgi:aspartate/methionine/tyrosine aminotransferase
MRRSGIREVMDLASRNEDVLHLEIGEPDFPTPPHVVEAAALAMRDGQVKYTLSRGLPTLRAVIASKLTDQNSITVTEDEVVVTTGGTTAVLESMLVLLQPGDGVLVPDPGWPSFRMATLLAGGRPLPYRLLPEAEYLPDLGHVEKLAGEARVLVLNTPSNPTGAVIGAPHIAAMLEIAERHDLVVISDEVYEDIVFEGEHVSAASLGASAPVISIFSFSKGYAMTGWRIGYLTGPSWFVEALVGVQEAVVACPSSVAQHAAHAALCGPQDCLSLMRDEYRRRRDIALELLAEESLKLTEPHGTFYVMADVGAANSESYEFAHRLLVERAVAVAPGGTFGDEAHDAVRLSLASPLQTIEDGIRRIGAAVQEWGAED